MHIPICVLLLMVGFRLTQKLKPNPSLLLGAGVGLSMGLLAYFLDGSYNFPFQLPLLVISTMAIVSPAMWLSARMEGLFWPLVTMVVTTMASICLPWFLSALIRD